MFASDLRSWEGGLAPACFVCSHFKRFSLMGAGARSPCRRLMMNQITACHPSQLRRLELNFPLKCPSSFQHHCQRLLTPACNSRHPTSISTSNHRSVIYGCISTIKVSKPPKLLHTSRF